METAAVEVQLSLADDIARKLRAIAQARGTTEAMVVEQALSLLFELDDTPTLTYYWFSVSSMREDWEAMPEDWIADCCCAMGCACRTPAACPRR